MKGAFKPTTSYKKVLEDTYNDQIREQKIPPDIVILGVKYSGKTGEKINDLASKSI